MRTIRKTAMNQCPASESRWIRASIPIGAGLFILALALSATLIPQLRLLHILQALIYLAVIVLTRRNSPWGFGAGVVGDDACCRTRYANLASI